MTEIMITPEELDPTNGNEKNENLQNDSEENTRESNTEKKSPIHVPGMIDRELEEAERKEAEEGKIPEVKPVAPTRDPSIWERKSVEDDEETNEDNSNNANSNSNSEIRDYKGSNKKLAGLSRVQSQKQKKHDRLVDEIKQLKAILKRGYRIVENNDGQVSHIPITSSENMIISFKISDKDLERFNLRFEIADLDQEIKELASKKRMNRITKKRKVAKSKQEDKLVKQITSGMIQASKNGSEEIVSEIQQHIQTGNKNEAYKSLKSFLSQQVKTVAKKLDKSDQLEKNVIGRVLDNLGKSQS